MIQLLKSDEPIMQIGSFFYDNKFELILASENEQMYHISICA